METLKCTTVETCLNAGWKTAQSLALCSLSHLCNSVTWLVLAPIKPRVKDKMGQRDPLLPGGTIFSVIKSE